MKQLRQSGLTLLEVVVAMSILLIISLSLMAMNAASNNARNSSREREIAMHAARARLEAIQEQASTGMTMAALKTAVENTTFDVPNPVDLPSGYVIPNADKLAPVAATTAYPLATVNSAWTKCGFVVVDTTTAPASGALPKVTVYVRWRSATKGSAQGTLGLGTGFVEMSTYVANRSGT